MRHGLHNNGGCLPCTPKGLQTPFQNQMSSYLTTLEVQQMHGPKGLGEWTGNPCLCNQN